MSRLAIIRVVGFAAIVVAAIVVTFVIGSGLEDPSSSAVRSQAAEALLNFELNEDGADSAPQQQVAAAWAAKDLLAAVARGEADGLDAAGSDRRVPLLLMLGVVGIAWAGGTSVISSADRRAATTGPLPPDRLGESQASA